MTTTANETKLSEHYSTGDVCVVHESCDGEHPDCRTGQGTRPIARLYTTRRDAEHAARESCPDASAELIERIADHAWASQNPIGTTLDALAAHGIDCEGYEGDDQERARLGIPTGLPR